VRSVIAIDIAAPADLVFRVVRDPTRWPALLPHYLAAQLVRRERTDRVIARYVAVRSLLPLIGLGLPVAWTSRSWADPATRELRFRHLGGATAGMDVTWRIRPAGSGCRVTIEHAFRRALPGLSSLGDDWYPRLVDRLFVQPIAGRTLRAVKEICEALVMPAGEDRPDGRNEAIESITARSGHGR
jgi:ribosome-associated toxin RatA of RatAB toxin-antitoxin module